MKALVISDVHGNFPALSAVANAEPNVDRVICLGDLVNYGPHPAACVDWAMRRVAEGWIVQGNHDRALGCDEDPRCSPPYRPLAAAMQRFTAPRLTEAHKRFLAVLPSKLVHILGGATLVLCHAVPSDPLYGYLPPDADPIRWAAECAEADFPDFLLIGHTHLQFARRHGRTLVVNPGSVGQPKDGDPRAAYAIWNDGQVELQHASYDIAATARDLEGCAEPEIVRKLAEGLFHG